MTLDEAQNTIIEVEQRWIKVNSRMAAGNQKSFSRLKTAIAFYQGKYTLLKVENNKLRQNATQLHQANETIKVLEYDNNKLKGEVEGLRSAVEELKKVAIESDKQRKEANEQLREAKKLLNEVFRKHEAGLLPDRFIYEKIKTFLYGE